MKAGFSCGLLEEENTRVLVPFVMWSILLYGIYYFVDPAYYGFDLRITPPQAVRKVRNSELDRPSALLWKG